MMKNDENKNNDDSHSDDDNEEEEDRNSQLSRQSTRPLCVQQQQKMSNKMHKDSCYGNSFRIQFIQNAIISCNNHPVIFISFCMPSQEHRPQLGTWLHHRQL